LSIYLEKRKYLQIRKGGGGGGGRGQMEGELKIGKRLEEDIARAKRNVGQNIRQKAGMSKQQIKSLTANVGRKGNIGYQG
jgi:hypothetical protein